MGRWAQRSLRGGGGPSPAVVPAEVVVSDVSAIDGESDTVTVTFTQDLDAGILTAPDWTIDGIAAGVIVQGADPNTALVSGGFSVTGGEAWSTTDPALTGPPTSGTVTPF